MMLKILTAPMVGCGIMTLALILIFVIDFGLLNGIVDTKRRTFENDSSELGGQQLSNSKNSSMTYLLAAQDETNTVPLPKQSSFSSDPIPDGGSDFADDKTSISNMPPLTLYV